jgi:hypothetical protein
MYNLYCKKYFINLIKVLAFIIFTASTVQKDIYAYSKGKENNTAKYNIESTININTYELYDSNGIHYLHLKLFDSNKTASKLSKIYYKKAKSTDKEIKYVYYAKSYIYGTKYKRKIPIKNFIKGYDKLKEGSYDEIFGNGAIYFLDKSYNSHEILGEIVAKILIDYALEENNNGIIKNILSNDKKDILNDAIKFDKDAEKYILNKIKYKVEEQINENEFKQAKKFIKLFKVCSKNQENKKIRKLIIDIAEKYLENKNYEKAKSIYNTLFTKIDESQDFKKNIVEKLVCEGKNNLKKDNISDAFEIFEIASEVSPQKGATKTKIVKNIRSKIKSSYKDQKYILAFDILNKFYSKYEEKFAEKDSKNYKNITKKLFTNYDRSFIAAYNTFKKVLSSSLFENCKFLYLDKLWKKNHDDKFFSDVIKPYETKYFYYDNSKVYTGSNGILLTDEAITWKNIYGTPKRIIYEDIKTIKLVYEENISFVSWKININNNSDLNVNLSGIKDESILPLLSSIVYFINYNRSQLFENIALIIPKKEKNQLNKSTIGKYKTTLIATGVAVAATAAAYYKSPTLRRAITRWGRRAIYHTSNTLKASKLFVKNKKIDSVYFLKGKIKEYKKYNVYDKFNNKIGKFKPKDFFKIKKHIKMKRVASPTNSNKITSQSVTSRGFLRNAKLFWKKYMEKFGDDLSSQNKVRIKNGLSPIVDKKWVKSYPSHKPFMGETIHHHHLNHGGKAIPLPATLHKSSLNRILWHLE